MHKCDTKAKKRSPFYNSCAILRMSNNLVLFAHGWITSMSLGGGRMSVDGTRSLTHSILIYLFIKSGLNNFLLPPLLSIVFVQACSVVFWQSGDKKGVHFLEPGYGYLEHLQDEVGHFGFMLFSFVNMLFFSYRLLLTRRWKLVEVFMTVNMYRSQEQGRRGQRIDTRLAERQS